MGLRNADTSTTKRFEDGTDWIELRVSLDKGEANALQQLAQNYRLPSEDGQGVVLESSLREYQRRLFDVLAVAWSLASGKPTSVEYEALDEPSGEWVDECMDQALAERRKRAEGNGRASKTPSSSGTRRRKAASSA